MRRLFFSVLLYAALASAQAGGPVPSGNTGSRPPPPHFFKDIAPQAGLSVAHISSPEKRYIIESVSGGIPGLFDCDNDGKLDIVAVGTGSAMWDRYRAQGGDPDDHAL